MFKKKYDTIKFTSLPVESIVNKLYFGGALAIALGLIIDGIGSDVYHNTAEKENHTTTELAAFFNKHHGTDSDANISLNE